MATESIFGHSPHEYLTPLGHPFGTQNLKSRTKPQKKQCPESSAEKTCSQRSTESAQCVIRTGNTICFVRSRSVHLGGFWARFGSLSGSLWITFFKKLRFGDLKTRINKKVRKSMKNGHASHPSRGLSTPIKVEAQRLEAQRLGTPGC